jgi:hypothetical protein
MSLIVGVAVPFGYGAATGSTVSYIIYDESNNSSGSGNLSEVGATGLFMGSFTPDVAGIWKIKMAVGTTVLWQFFEVGFGYLASATYGLDALHTHLVTVDNNQDISTVDGATNALERDAIGNKEDAAVVVVGTTKSIMGYVKGILTDVLLIKAKTDLIAGTTVVAADLATALTNVDLDHVTKTTYGGTKPAAGTLFDSIMNKGAGQTFSAATDSLEALQEAIAALSGGALATAVESTHTITTVNDKTETQMFEITETNVYELSIYLDLDTLETAVEGGTVTTRLYAKVDGTNYADKPIAVSTYVVGTSTEYPSFEVDKIYRNTKLTIQCSSDVSNNRVVAYQYFKRVVS